MTPLFLKVKLKSLAAESKIIRDLERRCPPHRTALREHRLFVVRKATRNTHLAYGYLRGLTYDQIECNPRSWPNWREVERMAMQYGCCAHRRFSLGVCEPCVRAFNDWRRSALAAAPKKAKAAHENGQPLTVAEVSLGLVVDPLTGPSDALEALGAVQADVASPPTAGLSRS